MVLTHRADLEFISHREVGSEEYESLYKCPECKKGVITRWKETTIGFKCSGWYCCDKCGYDPSKDIEG